MGRARDKPPDVPKQGCGCAAPGDIARARLPAVCLQPGPCGDPAAITPWNGAVMEHRVPSLVLSITALQG